MAHNNKKVTLWWYVLILCDTLVCGIAECRYIYTCWHAVYGSSVGVARGGNGAHQSCNAHLGLLGTLPETAEAGRTLLTLWVSSTARPLSWPGASPTRPFLCLRTEKDEINVPMALSVFRDGPLRTALRFLLYEGKQNAMNTRAWLHYYIIQWSRHGELRFSKSENELLTNSVCCRVILRWVEAMVKGYECQANSIKAGHID